MNRDERIDLLCIMATLIYTGNSSREILPSACVKSAVKLFDAVLEHDARLPDPGELEPERGGVK